MSLRPRSSQNLAIGTTSTTAAAGPGACQHVRLSSTVDCYVVFSPTGSAIPATASNGMLIRASTAGETFKCGAGEIITAITSAGTGVLSITWMSA